MKTCEHTGCNSSQFGGGYCAYHQYIRRKRGGDLYKPKPRQKQKKIPKESKKRKITAPIYRELTQKLWDDAVANGTNYCFFCNNKMVKKEDTHHLKGRDGFLFIDEEWLVIAHNKCHFGEYHVYSVEKLLSLPWYQGFLSRLRLKSEELYNVEMNKQTKAQKAHRLNPEINFDEFENNE